MIKTIAKTTTLLALLGTATYIGETIKPIQITTDFFKYHNAIASDGTPKDFWNYQTKIEMDSNKVVTLYFGNIQTNKFKRVQENGDVGTISEKIVDFVDTTKRKTAEFFKEHPIYDLCKDELLLFYTNITQ